MREKVTEAGAQAPAFFVGRVHNGPCLRPTGHTELSETDLRSHDPEHGWLHALAHGADAALFFALHPALPPDDRSAWVQALAPRLTPTFGQPRPVAMALTVQVARSLLLFTLLGAQLPGGQVIPAPAREGWPDELLAVLRLAFPAYPE